MIPRALLQRNAIHYIFKEYSRTWERVLTFVCSIGSLQPCCPLCVVKPCCPLCVVKGVGQNVSDYNLPRDCIRSYFPTRKCFTFPRPVEKEEDLENLDSLTDSQLKQKFLEKTDTFLQYVFDTTMLKSVNGRREFKNDRQ